MIYYTRSCREFRVSCYLDQVVSEGSRWVWCQFGEIVEHLVSDYQQPGWTLTSILDVHIFHSNLTISRVCEDKSWSGWVWCVCAGWVPRSQCLVPRVLNVTVAVQCAHFWEWVLGTTFTRSATTLVSCVCVWHYVWLVECGTLCYSSIFCKWWDLGGMTSIYCCRLYVSLCSKTYCCKLQKMWTHVWSIADKPSSVNVACNVWHMAESDSHCWTWLIQLNPRHLVMVFVNLFFMQFWHSICKKKYVQMPTGKQNYQSNSLMFQDAFIVWW